VNYKNFQLSLENISSSNLKSFSLFFSIGLLVLFFLFQTVHNRDIDKTFLEKGPRLMNVVEYWVDNGFLKHGGLWPRDPAFSVDNQCFNNCNNLPQEGDAVNEFYSSMSMGYMHFSFFTQKVVHMITGEVSYKLAVYQNQFYVLLSSALFGLLSLRLSSSFGVPSRHALILGLSTQLLYQTFPVNLFYYWGIYPSAVLMIFLMIFLIELIKIYRNDKIVVASNDKILFISVFMMAYVDLYSTIIFVFFFLFVLHVLDGSLLSNIKLTRNLIAPLGLALVLFIIQLIWVKFYFDATFISSTLSFRTGFDGDNIKYLTHANLIFHRIRQGSMVYQWYPLMGFCVVSAIIYWALNIFQLGKEKLPIILFLASVGIYLPYALFFTQSVVIHTKMHDPYMVAPLILIGFSMLPASLEQRNQFQGYYVFLFAILAFFFSMYNIRLFALEYPTFINMY